ncbi:hypothetical protein [Pedobacter cryoconitis]|uniref:hypothetical protein n=1 Tax=Pedobacter cryoconitis TaxID=188932 RepID=UPI000A4F3999|nr:hypothetical protein [Pedobacter cryoconitis]
MEKQLFIMGSLTGKFQREFWTISFLKQQFGVQVVSKVLYWAKGNKQWKPKGIRELSSK